MLSQKGLQSDLHKDHGTHRIRGNVPQKNLLRINAYELIITLFKNLQDKFVGESRIMHVMPVLDKVFYTKIKLNKLNIPNQFDK